MDYSIIKNYIWILKHEIDILIGILFRESGPRKVNIIPTLGCQVMEPQFPQTTAHFPSKPCDYVWHWRWCIGLFPLHFIVCKKWLLEILSPLFLPQEGIYKKSKCQLYFGSWFFQKAWTPWATQLLFFLHSAMPFPSVCLSPTMYRCMS